MKARYFLALMGAAMLLLSCEERIDIGNDGLGDQLMMDAQMSTADTVHTVYLSLSRISGLFLAENATISCYVNGTLADRTGEINEIVENPVGPQGHYKVAAYQIRARFAPGDKVKLTADAGELHCEAEVSVPTAPMLKGAEFTQKSKWEYKLAVDIEDNKGAYGYYFIRFYNTSYVQVIKADVYPGHASKDYKPGDIVKRVNYEVAADTKQEPLLRTGETYPGSDGDSQPSFFENEKNLFTDEMFRDGAYQLNVEIKKYEETVPTTIVDGDLYRSYNQLKVRLFHISKEEYVHMTGIQFRDSYESNSTLTGEFVYPHNVSGGLGFVAVNSESDIELLLYTKDYSIDNLF